MQIHMKQRKSLLGRELKSSICIVFFFTLSQVDKIREGMVKDFRDENSS